MVLCEEITNGDREKVYHVKDVFTTFKEINQMDFPSDSMQKPSYPSGHSLQSRLVAEYYIKKYPEHRKGLIAAAEECGQGRVKAGWHFPSDHDVGVLIATEIAPMVKL